MIKAVTYILENDSVVQALVGDNSRSDKHKVYPVIAPQSEIEPYIVVKLGNKTPLGSSSACGYDYNIIVMSYETSYDRVIALNQAVIDALVNYPRGTVNSVDYGGLMFTSESDEAFGVDRISVTHEHPVYAKVSTFRGMGSDGVSS